MKVIASGRRKLRPHKILGLGILLGCAMMSPLMMLAREFDYIQLTILLGAVYMAATIYREL